jgi:hypothetical protein
VSWCLALSTPFQPRPPSSLTRYAAGARGRAVSDGPHRREPGSPRRRKPWPARRDLPAEAPVPAKDMEPHRCSASCPRPFRRWKPAKSAASLPTGPTANWSQLLSSGGKGRRQVSYRRFRHQWGNFDSGEILPAGHNVEGGPSVFDAVAILPSAEGGAKLALRAEAVVNFLRDAYGHLKVIAYLPTAALCWWAGMSDASADTDLGLISLARRSASNFIAVAGRRPGLGPRGDGPQNPLRSGRRPTLPDLTPTAAAHFIRAGEKPAPSSDWGSRAPIAMIERAKAKPGSTARLGSPARQRA